jgi:hypothetical protein
MFDIYDKNNKKLECKILFTFNKENKDFIVYSDNEGEILASFYKIIGGKAIIYPILDDHDYDLVDEELERRRILDE